VCQHPLLISWPFPIYTYGVVLALAFVVAIGLAWRRGPVVGIDQGTVLDAALVVVVGSLAGARLLYIVLYPAQFPTWTEWFAIQRGGLVFYGGLLGAVAGVILLTAWRRIALLDLADLAAPCVAWGQAIGRLGCLMHGCCYGAACSWPWGMVFPSLGDGIVRHPTQLYEALFTAILGTILTWALAHRPWRGAAWGGYVCIYAVFRFFVEFFRADDRGGLFTPWQLSISQAIAVGVFGAGLLWLGITRAQAQRKGDIIAT